MPVKGGETSGDGPLQCLLDLAKANFYRRNLRRDSGKLELGELEDIVHSGGDIDEYLAILARGLRGGPPLEIDFPGQFADRQPVDGGLSSCGVETDIIKMDVESGGARR